MSLYNPVHHAKSRPPLVLAPGRSGRLSAGGWRRPHRPRRRLSARREAARVHAASGILGSPRSLGEDGAVVKAYLLEEAPAADDHTRQRFLGNVHWHARLVPQPLVQTPKERTSACENHPAVHDVRGKFGRRAVEGIRDRRDDSLDGYAYCLPELLAGYHYGLGQPRHQVPAPYLRRFLLLEPEGAAELYLELLRRLGAHRQLVLLLDVGGDGVVDVVTGYADRGFRNDAAKRDHGDLAGAAADIYYHGPLRLVDRQPRPYRRRQRLLDGVGLARPGRLCGLLDGPELDTRYARGHADYYPGPDQGSEKPSLRLHLADEVGEHLLRDLEVGDHAVLEGPQGHNAAGRAAEHPLGRRPDGHDLIGLVVYGDDGGFREHDPVPLDEHQRVRRSQVYRNVPSEQSSKHTRPICSSLTTPYRTPARLEHPTLLHTKVPVTQDHVVEHLYADNFGGARQPTRDLAILAARLDLAAGVVVREHHARRARPDGRFEDLPGMDERRRERADRDRRALYNLVLGVQEHGDEILPVKIGDTPPQKAVPRPPGMISR